MRRKAHRKTVRRRRHRGGASFSGLTQKLARAKEITGEKFSTMGQGVKARFSKLKESAKERFKSKSPFSEPNSNKIEQEPEKEPTPVEYTNNKNLSAEASPSTAAIGMTNDEREAKNAEDKRKSQGARPVPLPNNNAGEAVAKSEAEGERPVPLPNNNANNTSAVANNKKAKVNINKAAAANDHEKTCSCNECNAIKEAKKNCSRIRNFLGLCHLGKGSVVENDKKVSVPGQTQNSKANPSAPVSVPAQAQAQAIPPATAQDVNDLLTWLSSQVQSNPTGISRIIGQLAVIIGNPSQIEPWKMFIERLKSIKADTNPQSQQTKLTQLGSETWGPAAPGAPRPLNYIPPGAPQPSAPPEEPVQAGGRQRLLGGFSIRPTRRRRRARRHTRKMKRRM